jgi:adenylate cyclase
MPHEIERKFLLSQPLSIVLQNNPPQRTVSIEQRYLGDSGKWTARIRKTTCERQVEYFFTLKKKVSNVKCIEIETQVDETFYNSVAEQCGPVLRKIRSLILHDGKIWEVDQFLNSEFNGLTLAEIELNHEDDVISIPSWLGMEVTDDRRYKNAKLVRSL